MATRRRKRVNADTLCREAIERSPNLTVPWYLMTSYLYYHEDESLISDGLYDAMCKLMLDRWDEITHPHKHLIHKDALAAGSGFDIPKDAYPEIAKGAAIRLLCEG